jgi:hypothetical protein
MPLSRDRSAPEADATEAPGLTPRRGATHLVHSIT